MVKCEDLGEEYNLAKDYNLCNIKKHGSLTYSKKDGRYYLNLDCIMTWHLFKKIVNEISSLLDKSLSVSDIVKSEEVKDNPNFAGYKNLSLIRPPPPRPCDTTNSSPA